MLYTTSNNSYMRGYQKLMGRYKYINFTNELHFKDDLTKIIDLDAYYTVFFVDDIVWREPFTLQCKEFSLFVNDSEILCLSLRLDPNLNYCYALDINMEPPCFDDKLTWHWYGEAGDFGYPMSLDGHIFRTSEIAPLLRNMHYKNPNSLEGALASNPLQSKKMLCLARAPIFNIPINKVQTQNLNRHGNISANHLNHLFLDGYRISLSPLLGFRNNACHQEVELILEKSSLRKIGSLFKRWL